MKEYEENIETLTCEKDKLMENLSIALNAVDRLKEEIVNLKLSLVQYKEIDDKNKTKRYRFNSI